MKNLEYLNKKCIYLFFIFYFIIYYYMITDNNNTNNTTNTRITLFKDFLIDNYKQLFLIILVFVIIFIVEYITNINSILYGLTPVPGISTAAQLSKDIIIKSKKRLGKRNMSKKRN